MSGSEHSAGCIVRLSDSCPRLEDYSRVLAGCRVELDQGLLGRVEEARRAYLGFIGGSRLVYGAYTGVGALQSKRIHASGSELEERLVAEHAAGVGRVLDERVARIVLFTRVVQLTRGFSPVRPAVVETLVGMLNHGITPAIPAYGSVGASGDLAPLAHLALALTGKGRVFYRGRVVAASEAFREEGLEPIVLEKGEALSLINGTAYSTGILVYSIIEFRRLLEAWLRVSGLVLRLATCNPEHYSVEVVSIKKHSFPEKEYSVVVEELKRGSPRRSREDCSGVIQDPYSLRCTPQVIGAVYYWLSSVEEAALREACSPTDNPVVVGGRVYHQCSFHGVYVALAADLLAQIVALVGNTSERRAVHLLSSSPRGYEFLGDPGSPSGLMIAHYTLASLAARLRHIASPQSVHNIPTSMLQEDLVSMSANASLKALEAIRVLRDIVAVELLLAARLAYLEGVEVGEPIRGFLEEVSDIRKPVSVLIEKARKIVERI